MFYFHKQLFLLINNMYMSHYYFSYNVLMHPYFIVLGRDEIYVSRWFAYEALKFLEDRDEPRKRLMTVRTYNYT